VFILSQQCGKTKGMRSISICGPRTMQSSSSSIFLCGFGSELKRCNEDTSTKINEWCNLRYQVFINICSCQG
jgi:hypothetical protein